MLGALDGCWQEALACARKERPHANGLSFVIYRLIYRAMYRELLGENEDGSFLRGLCSELLNKRG